MNKKTEPEKLLSQKYLGINFLLWMKALEEEETFVVPVQSVKICWCVE